MFKTIILIDIKVREHRLDLLVDQAELERRRQVWVRSAPKVTAGYLVRYAAQVSSAGKGAVLRGPAVYVPMGKIAAPFNSFAYHTKVKQFIKKLRKSMHRPV